MYFKIFTKLFLFLCILKTVYSEDLTHQEDNHLDPVNDKHQLDDTQKDQDKRTLFSNHHNYGWAKHVGINSAGMKVVLGYSPVDLKYSAVIKPVHLGYHYHNPTKLHHHHLVKPVIQFKPSVPVPIQTVDEGWKPIVKPVVPVHVPPPQHIHQVVHGSHIHQVPVFGSHLHQVPVQSVIHGSHVHEVAKPVAKPILTQPFVPSPALFEVARPNLGVLPLGASFPSPVLSAQALVPQQVHPIAPQHIHTVPQHLHPVIPDIHTVPQHIHTAAPHVHPVAPHLHPVPQHVHPVAPHLHPVPQHVHPVAPHVHPVPQHVHPVAPHIHSVPQYVHPAAPHVHPIPQNIPSVIPQGHPFAAQPVSPGTSVEYHGTHHFVPFNGQVPVPLPANIPPLQPNPANVPHLHPHLLPNPINVPHLHPSNIPPNVPQIPQPHEQHDVQTPFLPANHPNFFNQQLPDNSQHNFQQPNVGPIGDQDIQNQLLHQLQEQQFQNQIRQQQEQQDQNHNIIQPGQTDLQIPLHLPQHNFIHDGQNLQQQESTTYHGNIFRPSISLEPPFVRSRNEVQQ